MIAEDQSSSPRAPSSSSTARCSRRHTPALVQAVNRRCAVAGETPNDGGRCRHAHPLVSTYTTAVKTARSSAGALPPPCERGVNDGSKGAVRSHNPSGTSRCNRSTLTKSHDAAVHHVTT
jgi:hypothetical protein